jgi:hypothetical protein
MFKIKEDSDGGYYFRKLKPVISMEDMLDTLNYFKNSEGLPARLNILEDARDVKVRFSIKEIPAIMKEAVLIMKKYDVVKHAIVYNSAIYTAYGLLAEKLVSRGNYYLRVYSSMEAAEKWIKSDIL